MTILRDEIIDILKDVYYNNDQADPFEPTYADLIIELFVKRINDEIPTRHDSNTVEEVNYTNGWNHAKSKVRDMLK